MYYFYAKTDVNVFSSFLLFQLCCPGGLSFSRSAILSTTSKFHCIKLSGLTSSYVWLLIKMEKLNFRRYQCCWNYFDYQNIVKWSEALKCFFLIFPLSINFLISSHPPALWTYLSGVFFFFWLAMFNCMMVWKRFDWLATLGISWIYLSVLLEHKPYLTCQNTLKVFLWFYLLNQQSGELSCRLLGEGRIWCALQ